MATLPNTGELWTVREYLRTSWSPDREYIDGRIEERNLGEKSFHHSADPNLPFPHHLRRTRSVVARGWRLEASSCLTPSAPSGYAAPSIAARSPSSAHRPSGRSPLPSSGTRSLRADSTAPASSITMRSSPSAMPPCGGVPYSSASRKNPNRCRASSSLMPSDAEDLLLHILAVNTDRSRPQLQPVHRQVVAVRAHATPDRSSGSPCRLRTAP